jgi:hypothetical protein
VHLTLQLRPGLKSLRHPSLFPAVRSAILSANGPAFRVVHFSVQRDHLHLIVEAGDSGKLSSGARGLSIRVARAINRALDRRGQVWGDRYHARTLTTPREVRQGLVYVLMNFRKHAPAAPPGLDPCSSAPWFDGFRDQPPPPPPASALPPPAKPRTWLCTVGWRRHGLIRLDEPPKW